MKYVIVVLALVLAGCSDHTGVASQVMTYQQLVDYPVNCKLADSQLAELQKVQQYKNFDSDPDMLNEMDRAYNSRLKATIWWFAYTCEKS